jgi:hypothetical protein
MHVLHVRFAVVVSVLVLVALSACVHTTQKRTVVREYTKTIEQLDAGETKALQILILQALHAPLRTKTGATYIKECDRISTLQTTRRLLRRGLWGSKFGKEVPVWGLLCRAPFNYAQSAEARTGMVEYLAAHRGVWTASDGTRYEVQVLKGILQPYDWYPSGEAWITGKFRDSIQRDAGTAYFPTEILVRIVK